MSNVPHKQKSGITAFTLCASIVLIVIAWIIGFASAGIQVSPAGWWELHKTVPVLWLLYLIPIAAVISTTNIINKFAAEVGELSNKLNVIRDRGDANAHFAQEIGSGNYEAEFSAADDDILGKSLMLMRDNLLENSKKEAEQLWISKGKDVVSEILRLHNNVEDLSVDALVNIIKYVNLLQGALYFYDEDAKKLRNMATYAYNRRKYINQEFSVGQGLIGQCAYEMDYIYRTDIPDDYATITSGILGDRKPASLLMVPLIADEKLQGVIEFASLDKEIPATTIKFLRELAEIIARTFFNLRVNKKTEKLLVEAQQMTEELRENEERLRQNAEEMRATQEELSETNEKLEAKIQEVQNAQHRLNSLLENASEIISIFDKNLKQTYESPSVKKIFGYTPGEVLAGTVNKYVPESEESLHHLFRQLLDNPDEPVTIECQCIRKDGSPMIVEITGRNLIKDDAIQGIILNTVDRTERKRAEKEERLRNKMQSLSENSLDVILRLSLDGVFFYANPVLEDYLGIPSRDIINNNVREAPINEDLKKYFVDTVALIKENPVKTNMEIEISVQMVGKTTTRIMNFAAIPEMNENELETILFVGHDITEAKRIELEIQEKNKKIEDSIDYAQRIQQSIIPSTDVIKKQLPNSFILYKPRDVVSGDFPWYADRSNNLYIAAVDCTGHGVPGALLSFIGYFTLNNIVDHRKAYTAGEICDMLHQGVRTTLRQDVEGASARDGMDIAFCKINILKNEVEYAGAHRPLYLLRNGEIIEFKGNRKAIGGIPIGRKPEEPFTTHYIKPEKGDKMFFFSDGLPDQLGGPEHKKYSSKRIREMIVEHQNYTMEEFNKLFEDDFLEWKSGIKQTDDVLLIGIEF
ncbi:MAG: PAS domain S-box protein [Bacteroidales bacterium]|jgi:PAS domain S-box-containing protein|nr:PAS domain S-box protein [Bacteroidales bacterium]